MVIASVLDHADLRSAVFPLSVEQYQKIAWSGVLPEDTELIRGYIIQARAKSPGHRYATERLLFFLLQAFMTEPDCYVTVEQPLTLRDSEPEPDLSVLYGRPRDYRDAHPNTARLVAEVAVTSQTLDREKALLYAEAGVSSYWLVDVAARQVEVFTNPTPEGYAQRIVKRPGEMLRIGELQLDPGELF